MKDILFSNYNYNIQDKDKGIHESNLSLFKLRSMNGIKPYMTVEVISSQDISMKTFQHLITYRKEI